MSDFTINIDSKLDLSNAETKIKDFIKTYSNDPIQIKVEFDPKSINTNNFGKQIQSSFSSAGTNAGKAFTKNMESTINRTNIDQLVSRLNAKGISKDIISGAEKSLDTLTKAGIKINTIKEVFSGDNLISLKIDGIDKGENAVSIVDKLNKKTKEWTSTTTYTTSFKDVAKDAESAKSKLLSLDEIKSRLFKAQGNVGSLQAQFGNVDKFSQDFNELGISIKNALSQADNGDASKLSSALAEIEGKVKTLTTATREWHKVNQTETDITVSAKKQLETTEKYLSRQKELQSQLDAFKKQNLTFLYPNSNHYSTSIVSEVKTVENAIKSISSVSDSKVASNMFSGLKASVKNAGKEIQDEINSTSKAFNQLDATTASNKTLTWLKNNSKVAKDYGDRLKELAELQRTATNADDLKNYTKQVNEIKTLAASQGKTGASFGAEFKRAFGQIGEFTAIYGTIQKIPQVISNMTTQVINVDDAITNLRMATSISNEEALKLMSTYSKLGDELKATSVDVAASATEWLKQGKSIQEAQNLAKDSIVLSKIGGLSSEESTKTITAAMKSYNMAESEVMGFVDKISAIDLVSATDVGGLSQAFNEVAANAKNAGVETEKLLSYAAVIGETSQEGMASVGTSLNAIFSRMGNIKLSRLKDYETGEDLSNVETVLRGVGIQLRDSQDQFREFDDVLDDTASKWASFSSVQQRAIASAFAGTHHMNSFLILMQNWNKVQEYTKTANEASGQSMEKFAAYQESATGKIEGFKNAFQSLSTTVIDSNVFKGLIDSGTTLLEILTQLIDVGGGMPLMLGAIGGTAFFKNLDWIY